MIEHEGDYCEQCGALWPKGQEVCAGCGTRQELTDTSSDSPVE
jgi:RNA polymerase subunit RPABC4/transcription elongation factor Spt4